MIATVQPCRAFFKQEATTKHTFRKPLYHQQYSWAATRQLLVKMAFLSGSTFTSKILLFTGKVKEHIQLILNPPWQFMQEGVINHI